MTTQQLEKLGDELAAATREFVERKIAEAISAGAERLAELERRVAELEARPSGIKWCGVWRETRQSGDPQSYDAANLVTHGGSLWVSTTKTTERPGYGPGWKLVVKRGGYDA